MVRFTIEVQAKNREEAEDIACQTLQANPELAEIYDVEHLWKL